jgi:hypothetical protein
LPPKGERAIAPKLPADTTHQPVKVGLGTPRLRRVVGRCRCGNGLLGQSKVPATGLGVWSVSDIASFVVIGEMQLLIYVSVVAASAVPHDSIPLHPVFGRHRGIAPPLCGLRQGWPLSWSGSWHDRGSVHFAVCEGGPDSFSIDAASGANGGCTLDGDDDGHNSGIQHQGRKYGVPSSVGADPGPRISDRGSAASTSNHCPTLVARPLIDNRGQRRKLGR